VKKEHLQEIFANYGTVTFTELPTERRSERSIGSYFFYVREVTGCSCDLDFFFLSFIQGGFHRGVGYVEFDKPEAAEKARAHMDEGQIDGNVVRIQFVVPPKVIRSSMLPFFCFFSSFLSFES